MFNIATTQKMYQGKVDPLDGELIVAHALKKSREFVLAHPEEEINARKVRQIRRLLNRRMQKEPLAYLFGEKEFFGLTFALDRSTLIPRPETELLVALALKKIQNPTLKKINIVDVGTGSGNIIITLAKQPAEKNTGYFATDISSAALKMAKKNAKKNHATKIKFIRGSLLEPFGKNKKNQLANSACLVLANLPYLSKKIYATSMPDVKKYEPRSALFSADGGLAHYSKLLAQIKTLSRETSPIFVILEFSPEQKSALAEKVRKILPKSKLKFDKDLAGKWRFCQIDLR